MSKVAFSPGSKMHVGDPVPSWPDCFRPSAFLRAIGVEQGCRDAGEQSSTVLHWRCPDMATERPIDRVNADRVTRPAPSPTCGEGLGRGGCPPEDTLAGMKECPSLSLPGKRERERAVRALLRREAAFRHREHPDPRHKRVDARRSEQAPKQFSFPKRHGLDRRLHSLQ